MLVGISPVISPKLLSALHRMGHGDEVVLADAHFPGHSMSTFTIRADGISVPALLDGILPLFVLDSFVDSPVSMMQAVEGDSTDPRVEQSYREVIDKYYPETPAINQVERFAFYERAKNAFAVVMTGETAKYGNVILKKGVTPT